MRTRSLREDKADDSAFKHSRDRMVGAVVETEFHQYCPHFFTRDRASLALEGMYKGSSIFLICNGPSFVTLNQDLLTMPGVITFGINNGAKTFRPNMWTCVDDPVRFLKSIWLDPKIQKFVPFSHMEKKIFDNDKLQPMDVKVAECPNVFAYCRNEKFHAPRFLTENSLNWGNHKDYGGGRSVMLPAIRLIHLLGFRKIYLLGCDMKMSETYTYHFDEQRSKGAVNGNMSTYDRLKSEYLPQLKKYFEDERLEIYNCNPDSELKVFPFISFDDAIKEATQKLGDVKNERVWGMYSKPQEKATWTKEPTKEFKPHLQTLETLEKTGSVSQSTFMALPKQSVQPLPKPPVALPIITTTTTIPPSQNKIFVTPPVSKAPLGEVKVQILEQPNNISVSHSEIKPPQLDQ